MRVEYKVEGREELELRMAERVGGWRRGERREEIDNNGGVKKGNR